MIDVPKSHPRYHSLKTRHDIIKGMEDKVVAPAGLIAHGRGESFDYLVGEATQDFATLAIGASASAFLLADFPVISVNGNVAALCPRELVELSHATGAPLEVNLFYKAPGRLQAIEKILRQAGATEILGLDPDTANATIPELESNRRHVDPQGILKADLVWVPLEDGDRTEALVKMGKQVITVDLNPLSRTSKMAHITIVDNIIRTLPALIEAVNQRKTWEKSRLSAELAEYSNEEVRKVSLKFIADRLNALGE